MTFLENHIYQFSEISLTYRYFFCFLSTFGKYTSSINFFELNYVVFIFHLELFCSNYFESNILKKFNSFFFFRLSIEKKNKTKITKQKITR